MGILNSPRCYQNQKRSFWTHAENIQRYWNTNLMTPYNFLKRFNSLCRQYGHEPESVWHHCDMDEHQVLIDEHPGEWEDLEQCLRLWANRIMTWEKRHDVPLPELSCKTCNWFDEMNCGWHKKAIPNEYDLTKACNHWNEEK